MRTLAGSPRPLKAVIDLGRRYSDALCNVLKEFNVPHYKRAALAVYFYAIEGILQKEHRRLSNQLHKFSAKVLQNAILHKSFLTFAWETTAAAYGKKDLNVFTVAYRAFNVSPFELTKALDAFCTLVPQMPRSLVNHMINCDARILEWMAWRHDSPLVNVLQAYGRDRLRMQQSSGQASAPGSPQTPQHRNSSSDVQPSSSGGLEQSASTEAPSPLREMERPERLYSDVEARVRVLDFFYEKVFALAGTRTEELLRRLNLTCLRKPVWRSIKYCLWCRWNLVINRHVDLIIMCVIYGVAKVQHLRLRFREIVHEYKQMEHTCDPTFDCESAAVYRNITLDDYGHLIDYKFNDDNEDAAGNPVLTEKVDIIRFYNKSFVPHMKQFILPIGDETLPLEHGDGMEVDTGGPSDGDGTGREEAGAGEDGEVELNTLARAASRQRGLRREEMFQDLGRKLLESPMRVLRTRRSPRRIGHIIVSPMSPSTRNMVANRQSSGRRGEGASGGPMTPGTRRLFSFGESPMPTLTPMETREGADGETGLGSQYVPLSFDGPVAQERSAAFRREVQMIIGRSGREPDDDGDEESSQSESSSWGNRRG
ncbi:Retinoblastoma-associated protein [Gracilariopsis chorda]|uniref:Retinoblastoma-associated protein n=1 Tax=Gracilariopsis chorda TaxID=448386 RepID=A0A2V3IIT0_9FLOR|nr:Retinoblastoma-associated protein [Gracilariopsis chorda]|eukprot:PXF41969.1 Retinoblastoma-associated protein [Gracilariopsis chorda]